jgi:outer membrane receptor protein involved in Fe transport
MIRSARASLLAATAITFAWGNAASAQQSQDGQPIEAGASPDTAQQQPEAKGPPAEEPAEIVITARKVAEKLSDAPVSVSVVGSSTITDRGLTSIDDFAKNATGISFSQAFGRSTDRPVVRGQSNVLAGVQFGVETGAAYFVDGIYYQGDIQGFDPLSIDRVEIIKGPQSALYGRNTYAGAINYITKDPSRLTTFSGRTRFAAHGEVEAAGSVSGQIVEDKIGFRAGARYYRYGGEYRNQLTGDKVGNEKTTSFYSTLTIRPSDDVKVRLRGSFQKDRDGPLALFLHGADLNNCAPGFRSIAFRQGSAVQPVVGDTTSGQLTNNNQYYCGALRALPERLRLNTDALPVAGFGTRDGTAFDGIRNRQYNLSSIFDWDVGGSGWTLSSLTGFRDNLNLFGTDSDHSEAFFFLFPSPANATSEPAFTNTNRDKQIDFSQEVRLSTPVDRPLRAMIGAYHYRQEYQTVDLTFAAPTAGEPLGSNNSAFTTIRNRALFGLVAADVTPQLTVTGEIRYATERKTVIDRVAATTIFCAGEAGKAARFGFTGNCFAPGTFKGWDPRITIDYKPSEDWLVYGVYAHGRKPGGFNGTGGLSALALTGQDLTRYEQERAKGGEIGTKFDLFGNRLSLGLAAFYNRLTGVQLTRSIPPSAPGQTTTSVAVNSGNARTQGIEVEAFARPARGLDLQLGYSLADAKFTKGCDFDYFVLNSGGLQPNFNTSSPTAAGLALCDISGKQLPLGSKHMLNGAIDYRHPISAMLTLVTNASFSYESKKYIQTDNLAFVPSAWLLNARIGVRTDRFTISAFGRNLTDEDAPSLATRWFDYRYGNAARNLPAPIGGVRYGTFNGSPAAIDVGAPRAFFAPLRRGRTLGAELTFNF